MAFYLIRHPHLPEELKKKSLGPEPGGRWWALEDHFTRLDLSTRAPCKYASGYPERQPCPYPHPLVRVRLKKLLDAGCRVWARLVRPGDTDRTDPVSREWYLIRSEEDMQRLVDRIEVRPRRTLFYNVLGEVEEDIVSLPNFVIEAYVVGQKGGLYLPPEGYIPPY